MTGDQSAISFSRRRAIASGCIAALTLTGCINGRQTETPDVRTQTTSTTEYTATPTPRTHGTNWPRKHRDASNSDYHPDARGPTKELEEKWAISKGDPKYGLPTVPVVFDGMVFFGGPEGSVYAADAGTGNVRWSTEIISQGSIEAAPAVMNGVLYVNDTGYGENRLHALDPKTGEELWVKQYGNDRTGAINGRGETLYFGTFRQDFFAIESKDGSEQWSTGGLIKFDSTPAVGRQGVFVSFYDDYYPGGVVGFDRLTGNRLWFFRELDIEDGTDTANSGTPTSTPAVKSSETRFQPAVALGADTVFFASVIGKVFALTKDNGDERWSFSTNKTIATSPVVIGDRVVVTDGSGSIYALNKTDGSVAWDTQVSMKEKRGILLVGVGDALYGIAGKLIFVVDASSGSVKWKRQISKEPLSKPIIGAGHLFIRTRESIVCYK